MSLRLPLLRVGLRAAAAAPRAHFPSSSQVVSAAPRTLLVRAYGARMPPVPPASADAAVRMSSDPEEDAADGEPKKKRRPPPPPRAPLEPTTFDGKATPRDVHNRPALRGMPAGMTAWEMERAASRPRSNRAGPRPPPRPRLEEHIFKDSASPRAIYSRPSGDLPMVNSRWGLWIALGLAGVGAWGLFILYATNNERFSSSVVRQVHFQLRNSPEVAALLGDHVRFARNWWGFGEPWIAGNINLMQGRIDVKFRMRGDKQEGTVYFTSIRPTQGAPWRIVRYKVIGEYGDVVRLEDKAVRPVVEDKDAEDAMNAALDSPTPGPATAAANAAQAEASKSQPEAPAKTAPAEPAPAPQQSGVRLV